MEEDVIVERLKFWAFKFCGKGGQEDKASDAMTAGWEEIERLRDENEKLRNEKRIVVERKFWESYQKTMHEIERLREDNTKLRAALRKIAYTDYRGTMPEGMTVARKALGV